jgi:RNA polymerase sigma factor (sigma-70 family)
MATNRTGQVIRHLRKAVLRQDGAGMTDGQLLGCFVERRDEAAFAALVKRHGPMVWGVCRRLLPHHDAEDAFQAAFLVLVRKAASVVPREMVANWLYGVAHQTALHSRRTTARRRAREGQVAPMPEPAVAEQGPWHDLLPLLDQELARLPAKYRVAIVLCDLEGKTRKEAAGQLGCPEGTLAARLARGRVMLARRLARHGLAVSGGALAAVLSQQVASANMPTSVVSSTIKAASMFAAGQSAAAGAISVKVAALTEGVVKAMLLTNFKAVSAVLLIVAALGSAAGLIYQAQADERAREPKAVAMAGNDVEGSGEDRKDNVGNATDEKKRLDGEWVLTATEQEGMKASYSRGSDILLTLTGETFRLAVTTTRPPLSNESELSITEYTYKVDSGKSPRAIDLYRSDAEPFLHGIYRLDKDRLTLCWGERNKDRPTDFDVKLGSGRTLQVFKRREHRPKKQGATEKADKEKQAARNGQEAKAEPSGKNSPEKAGKEQKVLTPDEAVRHGPNERVTVQFKVTSAEVTPLDGPQIEGYAEGPQIRLKDGGKFSVLLMGPAADQIRRLAIEPDKHFGGKVVRVTGRVQADHDEGPPFSIWVDDLNHFEVVRE